MPTFHDYLIIFRESLDSDFIPGIVLDQFIDFMQDEHPDEYQEWLEANGRTMALEELTTLLRRERARNRAHGPARDFNDAVNSGDDRRLDVFREVHVINDKGTRRALGDMTADDCLYVANSYDMGAKRLMAQKALFSAIYENLLAESPNGTVRDVYTPEQMKTLIMAFNF